MDGSQPGRIPSLGTELLNIGQVVDVGPDMEGVVQGRIVAASGVSAAQNGLNVANY